jgi:type IV pilus assembly protein PilX
MFIKSSSLQRQSGVVMVISLIMLMLLTLIGITATQVTSLEEKMAGNSRDQNIAFQAAEAVLRDGENLIETAVLLSYFSDANDGAPLFREDEHPDPDYRALATWGSANVYSATLPLVASQPLYYIKYIETLPDANSNASINIGNYGSSSAGEYVSRFSVTAKGTGRQDTSQVFLQSYYAKKF